MEYKFDLTPSNTGFFPYFKAEETCAAVAGFMQKAYGGRTHDVDMAAARWFRSSGMKNFDRAVSEWRRSGDQNVKNFSIGLSGAR